MKPRYCFFVFIIMCAFQVKGQSFSKITVGYSHDQKQVSFTISKEINVRYYRVEASNDSINYEVLGSVRAMGNSMFPKSYSYMLYPPYYKYYRVGIVGMNASMEYSPVVTEQKAVLPETIPQNVNGGSNVVLKNSLNH